MKRNHDRAGRRARKRRAARLARSRAAEYHDRPAGVSDSGRNLMAFAVAFILGIAAVIASELCLRAIAACRTPGIRCD